MPILFFAVHEQQHSIVHQQQDSIAHQQQHSIVHPLHIVGGVDFFWSVMNAISMALLKMRFISSTIHAYTFFCCS